jgi:hypothetical protein
MAGSSRRLVSAMPLGSTQVQSDFGVVSAQNGSFGLDTDGESVVGVMLPGITGVIRSSGLETLVFFHQGLGNAF